MKKLFTIILLYSLPCIVVYGQQNIHQNEFDAFAESVEYESLKTNELKQSINNTIQYFENLENVEIATMFNYHYLQKRFNVKKVFPTELIDETLNKYDNIYIYSNALYYRLVNKDFTISEEALKNGFNNLTNEITLKSLYCGDYPVEANFLEILRSEADKDGYNLTHSLLALQWLKENDCIDSEKNKKTEEYFIRKSIELINSAKEFDDLTIEAIAFVQYAGYHGLISEKWIQKIIALQQKDGGWKWSSKHGKTSEHTSVVALWVLLEWLYPGKTISWIE